MILLDDGDGKSAKTTELSFFTDDYEIVMETEVGLCSVCGQKSKLIQFYIDGLTQEFEIYNDAVQFGICPKCFKKVPGVTNDG
jgi:hypothetical protein